MKKCLFVPYLKDPRLSVIRDLWIRTKAFENHSRGMYKRFWHMYKSLLHYSEKWLLGAYDVRSSVSCPASEYKIGLWILVGFLKLLVAFFTLRIQHDNRVGWVPNKIRKSDNVC
ncbi:hypothetical protein LXL04_007345 [Taraxacum kok-saghyz]